MSAMEQYRPVWSWWDFKVCSEARDGLPVYCFHTKVLSESLIFTFFFSFVYPQVHESDADDQDFGAYALAFAAGE